MPNTGGVCEVGHVRFWLEADITTDRIDFRYTPNCGHSVVDVRFRTDCVRYSLRSGHPWCRCRLPLIGFALNQWTPRMRCAEHQEVSNDEGEAIQALQFGVQA